MRAFAALYALALSLALSVEMISVFSTSPETWKVRLIAGGCAAAAAWGLVHQLRRLS